MNARVRVMKALNHEEPDRVPIVFGGTAQKVSDPLMRRWPPTSVFRKRSWNGSSAVFATPTIRSLCGTGRASTAAGKVWVDRGDLCYFSLSDGRRCAHRLECLTAGERERGQKSGTPFPRSTLPTATFPPSGSGCRESRPAGNAASRRRRRPPRRCGATAQAIARGPGPAPGAGCCPGRSKAPLPRVPACPPTIVSRSSISAATEEPAGLPAGLLRKFAFRKYRERFTETRGELRRLAADRPGRFGLAGQGLDRLEAPAKARFEG